MTNSPHRRILNILTRANARSSEPIFDLPGSTDDQWWLDAMSTIDAKLRTMVAKSVGRLNGQCEAKLLSERRTDCLGALRQLTRTSQLTIDLLKTVPVITVKTSNLELDESYINGRIERLEESIDLIESLEASARRLAIVGENEAEDIVIVNDCVATMMRLNTQIEGW